MRNKMMTLAVYSTIAVAFLGTILAIGRTGYAQATLAQAGGCPNLPYSQYCTQGTPNPCNQVPGACFDYLRWFSNPVPLSCANTPGKNVTTGSDGAENGNSWSACQPGSTPGYNCTNTEAACGTFDTYWGAACEQATFCGNETMQACIGTTPYDCEGAGN